jgi:RsiW-degrading membrane proteinase PrsW (M82 family)
MSDIVIIAVAVLPPLFMAAFFLTHFRHRFGLALGAKAVIGGMISAPLALGFSLMLARLGLPTDGIAGAAVRAWIGAAIPEEVAKFLIVWFYIRRHPSCDSAGDLFCGSVLVGIGFALLENILYVTGAGPGWFQTGMMRAVLAVPGHTIDGMVMGVFLAWWWRKAIPPVLAILLALVLPIMAHGLYDFPLMALSAVGEMGLEFESQYGASLYYLFIFVLAISALAAIWAARAELIEVFRHREPDIDLHPGHPLALRLWRWLGWLVMLAAIGIAVFGIILASEGDPTGAGVISIALLPAAFGAIMAMRLPSDSHTRIRNWPRLSSLS